MGGRNNVEEAGEVAGRVNIGSLGIIWGWSRCSICIVEDGAWGPMVKGPDVVIKAV